MVKLLTFTVVSFLLVQLARAQTSQPDSTDVSANEYMHRNSHESLAIAFDSSERDSWQQPDTVISFLGDLAGKTIIDLGSGSGYFTFRLLKTGAHVIAADVDEEFLSIIEQKKQDYSISENRLKTVHIDDNQLNVEKESTDIIFMVNVYHHISDRVKYFSQANAVLKEGGKIVIVDFYKRSLPVGPPKNHKIAKEVVMEELEKAGYKSLVLNTSLLIYQYIIEAERF